MSWQFSCVQEGEWLEELMPVDPGIEPLAFQLLDDPQQSRLKRSLSRPQVFKKLVPQFGSIKQPKSASHGLVLILGTLNKPVPDVLRDVDLS